MTPLRTMEANLAAIELALQLASESRTATESEAAILRGYAGFGSVKEVLYPPYDAYGWTPQNQHLRPLVQKLHGVLDGTGDKMRYMQSIKNSVLTSFYTPTDVVDAIAGALQASRIRIETVLDPSAGTGQFIEALRRSDHPITEGLQYEKDLLTALILKGLSRDRVIGEGFETAGGMLQGKYDLVTSNIPFGSIPIYDPVLEAQGDVQKQACRLIHNYFAVKSLDSVRPGGLIALITTDNFLNTEGNRDIRRWMISQASLVSAVRLPNDLFEGTAVGTDLIVMQKRLPSQQPSVFSPRESSFIESRVDDNQVAVSDFYLTFPGQILATRTELGTNQYGKPGYQHFYDQGESFAQQLQKRLSDDLHRNLSVKNFQRKVTTSPVQRMSAGQLDLFLQTPAERQMTRILFTGNRMNFYREGILVREGQRIGRLERLPGGDYEVAPIQLSPSQERKFELLLPLRDTYFQLVSSERDLGVERPDLRRALNERYDAFVARFGVMKSRENLDTVRLDSLGRELMTLERWENEQYQKTDIFHGPVHLAKAKAEQLSAKEALISSLNKFGAVNLDHMAEVAQLEQRELIDGLQDVIYFSPTDGTYQTTERMGSGNIREKIKQVEAYTDPESLRTLDFLARTLPAQVPFHEIGFNLGERWIPQQIYADFASELFQTRSRVTYASASDDFHIQVESWNALITDVYGYRAPNQKYNGPDLLRFALLDDLPNLTIKIGEATYRDTESLRAMAQKTDSIRREFQAWMERLPDEKKTLLEDRYNELFNSHVKPKWDGTHLELPGMDKSALGIKDLYASQKDATWMMLQNAGGIADHEVGAGKTLIMVTTAYEMKRLGLAAKPMLIGMKANTQQIAETFRRAYPDAKILAPGENDFTPKNREKLFDRIANESWDCIILTHDQFNRIPHNPAIQEKVIRTELEHLEKNTEELSAAGMTRFSAMYKGLEKRKAGLGVQLERLSADLKTHKDQNVIDFQAMGIDFLQVDESHKFKNLLFNTRHDRVAGLGNQAGSQRAMNLLQAVRTIQDKRGSDSGVAFYSGTTISNSLTELYLLFKYLRPRELERQQISNFDSWLAVYSQKSTDYEISVTNQLIEKARFRTFIKVPELAAFYGQITDFRTAKMVGVDRPEAVTEMVAIKQTVQQKDFTENLLRFAQLGDATLIGRPPLAKSEETAKMLIATNYSKKAALDMRLIDPDAGDHPGNKVNQAADHIADIYTASTPYRGTQLVFCDLGTPQSDEKFSVYAALKQTLMEKHDIPAHEIRFIHEAQNDRQRDQLIRATNEGEIRILVGSTEKLGTGVNAQRHVVAMHHLDVPWKPSDFEQRVGRGSRAGNEVAKKYQDNQVKNFVYAVEGSLDNFMFNLLSTKANFIAQIKDQNIAVRKIDEGSVDESTGMNYAEYVAILSGDTDLLEKLKVEKRLTTLETERTTFFRGVSELEGKIRTQEHHIASNERILLNIERDIAALARLPGGKIPAKESIGSWMILQNSNPDRTEASAILPLPGGFKLISRPLEEDPRKTRFSIESPHAIHYRYNNGFLTAQKMSTAAEWVNKALGMAPELKATTARVIEEHKGTLDKLKTAVQKQDWPKQTEYDSCRERLREIEARLNTKLLEARPAPTAEESPVERQRLERRLKI